MKYRVIEGGFWRHGSLHVESDFNQFESDNTGIELYKDMTNWLIDNQPKFSRTYGIDWWPEFFNVFNGRKDGFVDILVGEESNMWFVPETSPYFEEPAPPQGVMDSWIHGSEDVGYSRSFVDFFDMFPDGHERVPLSLPGEYFHSHYHGVEAV